MEQDLEEAFRNAAEVLDPSYFDNEHRGQFVADLDREDAFLDVASDHEDRLRVGDDIFADGDASVSDDQACAGEERALDASADHTLDAVADDEEVLAFHLSQLHATYVGVLVDALAEMMVEVPYLVLDDILKSFHSVALHEHYFHYLVVTSCLSLRAVAADVDLEESMDSVVHHSAVLANSLAVTLVAVVDIHLLSNFDYQYHFVNVPVVEMPLFFKRYTSSSRLFRNKVFPLEQVINFICSSL